MADDHDAPHKGVLEPIGYRSDGTVLGRLRTEEDGERTVAFTPVPDGKPPAEGEYAYLTDMPGTPYLAAEVHRPGSGPPKVNSQAYRDGWERIFGPKAAGEA